MSQDQQVAYLIKGLLENTLPYLDAIVSLAKLRHCYSAELQNDFNIFVVIASELDHLPVTEGRILCSKEWLAKCDKEVLEAMEFYKDRVTASCANILKAIGP